MNAYLEAIAALNNARESHDKNHNQADYELRQAEAYAAIAQAEAQERIATQLGNIHQALMTPNADGEPLTVADLLKRQTTALEKIAAALYTNDGDLHVLDALYAIAATMSNQL